MAREKVSIDRLRIDGGIQSRAAIDPDTVKEYAEATKEGKKRKEGPIVAHNDGEALWVSSGFTWLAAERLAGSKEVLVEVLKGSKRDALRYSLAQNAEHGRRRTPEDKRHAVKLALADAEWAGESSRTIAEMCHVSVDLVEAVRKELPSVGSDREQAGEEKNPETRTGRDGRNYQAGKPKTQRKPGDEDEESPPKKKRRNAQKATKNGQEVFDMKRAWDAAFGPVRRFSDDVARALPEEKCCSEYYAHERLCKELLANVTRWQKKITQKQKAK